MAANEAEVDDLVYRLYEIRDDQIEYVESRHLAVDLMGDGDLESGDLDDEE